MRLSHRLFIFAFVLVIFFWGMFLFNLDKYFVNGINGIILEKARVNPETAATQIIESSSEIVFVDSEEYSDSADSSKVVEKKDDSKQNTNNESDPNPKLTEYRNQKEIESKVKSELESKLKRFEKEDFQIKGTGNAWEGAPHISKQAQINLKLEPVKGAALTQFEITEGKITIGDSTFNFKSGTVEINDSEIFVNILANGNSFPFANMRGTIDSPVIDSNYKSSVKFENQLFYMNSADKTPFHFSFNAVLTDRLYVP